jgi:5-methylcytosine-specific restriction endonuclease McrA
MASKETRNKRGEGYCSGCAKRPALPGKKSCGTCLAAARNRYRPLREKLINKYGGACAACGCTDPVALTIDHINDDGCHERRKKTSMQLYREALEVDREDLQVLCANCQLRKVNLGPDFQRWGWTGRCECGMLQRGVTRDPS